MSRVRLSAIAKKPKFLAEFPLLGLELSDIEKVKADGANRWILEKSGIPPFGNLFETGADYAVGDGESLVEVTCVHREKSAIHVEPRTTEDAIALEDLEISHIYELTICKVRDPDFLSVPERITFHGVRKELALLRESPDFDFRGKMIRDRLNQPDAQTRLKEFADMLEADGADEAAIAEKELGYRVSIISEMLESGDSDSATAERLQNAEEIRMKILDLSRQQLEILSGLKPNTLADWTQDAIQEILAACNSEEDNSAPVDNPVEKSKAKKSRSSQKLT